VDQARDPVNPAGGDDINAIRGEIERTRTEMSETIGEIQDRLRPDHLLEEAKSTVKEAAAEKARTIMSSAGETAATVAYRARGLGEQATWYAQNHPLYVGLLVGAATWWMLRRREPSYDWQGVSDTSWEDDQDAEYMTDSRSSVRGKVGEYASSARETVGQYASTAREAVGDYADSARTSARRASERVRYAAGSATSSVDTFVHDNPMAAGMIALAVGAALAMSMPRTEIEDRTMGETRDQALEKASRVAREVKDRVAERAQSAAVNVVGESIAAAKSGSTEDPNLGRA
jgi:ElaB/YqjD/DUF883 family membrane-anchored ribosome-binding protein